MTIKELSALIGTERIYSIPLTKGKIVVKVLDVKSRYGRIDLVVEPVNGSGQMTVRLESTTPKEQAIEPTEGGASV